jgi:hypothetical protein
MVTGQSLLFSVTASTESTRKQPPHHREQLNMAGKMTTFFKPKPKAPESEMLYWKISKAHAGTTARVTVREQARVGSFVMHPEHGKVTLVSQPAPDKLEIEFQTDTSLWPVPGGVITSRKIVDAGECSDPTGVARARDASVYMDTDEAVAAALAQRAIATAISACGEAAQPAAAGKAKAKAAPAGKGKGKAKATDPTAPKNKGGRPKGSKDKQPRKLRGGKRKELVWQYGGTKVATKYQVAAVGDTVEHEGIGQAVLLGQTDDEQLQLQVGSEGKEYMVTVPSRDCFVVGSEPSPIAEGAAVDEAGGSSAGGSGAASSGAAGSGSGAGNSAGSGVAPKRRKSGGRKRRELTPEQASYGLSALSTKADVEHVQKRQKREAAAAKRGRPLKPLRAQKNRKWPAALKEQAVALYHRKYGGGKDWVPCTKELVKLPGFEGLTSANLRAWVIVTAARAEQEPNEYGLLVTQAGRAPVLPAELYEELKTLVKSLAATRAIRICASSMQPVVLPIIIHRLGADVIRPGQGGFLAGPDFLQKLAKDAGLRWRKPYGDARKAPADADAQIHDMILRLAFLMKEHAIPRALVLNFDHTGMHFMQQRGNTYTAVEEDTATAHQSRRGKQKETKLQGVNDKRQATGTVGTSFAGDVCPGQLIVEGVPTSHGALPELDGCEYAKPRGSNPGHAVGWRLVQHGLDASRGSRERKWIGHLTQTTNHWANIETSYAILEFIIIPWLLSKKASMDLPSDHPAILIIDCWYGWKDQDKKKTLQNFRECARRGSERVSLKPHRRVLTHVMPFKSCSSRCSSALRLAQAALCASSVHRLSPAGRPRHDLVAEGQHACVFQ